MTATGRSKMRDWARALRACVGDIRTGELTDRAAALTYYGILSIFPGLLVLVSVLGLVGGPTSGLNEVLSQAAPGQAGEFMAGVVNQVSASGATAGLAAAVGLVLAFWSASGYMAAFIRAVTSIEGSTGNRPATRSLPIRLGLTAAVGLLLVLCAFLVVFTGGFARRVGEAIGLGSAVVTAWDIAKWPVLVALVAVLLAILYGAAATRDRGWRWITAGSVTAVLLWIAVSALFGVYLSTVASYQRTYGALSGAIIFLVWLWLTNVVVMLGADLDARLDGRRET